MADGLADVKTGVAQARETLKALPVCEALQWSIAARLIAAAPRRAIAAEIEELHITSEQHALSSHLGMALCYRGCEYSLQGKHTAAIEFLTKGLERLKKARYGPFDPLFVGVLASASAASGQVREGLRILEAFEISQEDATSFGRPDFLRRKARLLMLIGEFSRAESILQDSTDLADEQGAAVWRLRSATDLAELRHGKGHNVEAVQSLRAALDVAPETLLGPHRRRAQKLLCLWE